MKHIVNKGLLLIAAFVLIYTQHIAVDTRLIAAILLSMIASAIYPALSGISASTATKYDRTGIQGGIYSHLCETLICLYLISVFFLEPMYFFVSLVSYDIYRYRQRFSSALLVLLSVYTVAENTCASPVQPIRSSLCGQSVGTSTKLLFSPQRILCAS